MKAAAYKFLILMAIMTILTLAFQLDELRSGNYSPILIDTVKIILTMLILHGLESKKNYKEEES